ncbi:MAG: SDR family oxidoreductase [Pseudohongiella sp.]|uniref:SDR family oxidoreductase n=1 Tax=Pseudohongiella sp. TaxID=1979412 RepID=UPI0034A0591A
MSQPRVVITGVSRRLGLYLAQSFLNEGWEVIGITRSASKELRDLQNNSITIFKVKEYDGEAAAKLGCTIAQQFDFIDVIVHNASFFGRDEDFSDNPVSFFNKLFQVHMAFPAELNDRLRKNLSMRASSGNIVHITDIYAVDPSEHFSYYCATKAGLENLTKSMALRFAPNIRVNSVLPGPIQFLPEHDSAYRSKVLSETPLKQEGGFGPIYQAICSIIENPYITGSSIKVDGGRSLKNW